MAVWPVFEPRPDLASLFNSAEGPGSSRRLRRNTVGGHRALVLVMVLSAISSNLSAASRSTSVGLIGGERLSRAAPFEQLRYRHQLADLITHLQRGERLSPGGANDPQLQQQESENDDHVLQTSAGAGEFASSYEGGDFPPEVGTESRRKLASSVLPSSLRRVMAANDQVSGDVDAAAGNRGALNGYWLLGRWHQMTKKRGPGVCINSCLTGGMSFVRCKSMCH